MHEGLDLLEWEVTFPDGTKEEMRGVKDVSTPMKEARERISNLALLRYGAKPVSIKEITKIGKNGNSAKK